MIDIILSFPSDGSDGNLQSATGKKISSAIPLYNRATLLSLHLIYHILIETGRE
jgi:hypothetical protein